LELEVTGVVVVSIGYHLIIFGFPLIGWLYHKKQEDSAVSLLCPLQSLERQTRFVSP
jgi:hypothetical protein